MFMKNDALNNVVKFNFDNTYARLNEKLFSRVNPKPVKQPTMVLWNDTLAKDLGIAVPDPYNSSVASIFAGNVLPTGSEPLSQAYAGHQFGYFTMLGDGRAILLGEQITPDGKRKDIQFKGSGQTPYSRSGDGKATLYSMLREYLVSEAVHFLGIPSSRSLAVVTTGEQVYRETVHQGAVLTRVASSHIRVGTFEYIRYMQPHLLEEFTRYVIQRHYPEIEDAENPALELLRAVMVKQADLIAQWMRVGFIHGVMNTDNTGIPAETFDYGPCAFLNDYHPQKVFSSIDHHGRYAFGNQPGIMQWNLGCFAVTLLALIHKDEKKATEMVKQVLEDFENVFSRKYFTMMGQKLGIEEFGQNDPVMVEQLLQWMQTNQADYTNTFIHLERTLTGSNPDAANLYQQEPFRQWLSHWKQRIGNAKEKQHKALEIMKRSNPFVIPRNHLVENALESAVMSDYKPLHALMKVLSKPYERQEANEFFQSPPPQGDKGYQTFCGT